MGCIAAAVKLACIRAPLAAATQASSRPLVVSEAEPRAAGLTEDLLKDIVSMECKWDYLS